MNSIVGIADVDYICPITYVESMGNYLTIFTTAEKILIHGSIKDLITKLPDYQFIRVHKSYIVAFESIKNIEGNQILLGSEKADFKIPIGEVFRSSFFQFLDKKVVN